MNALLALTYHVERKDVRAFLISALADEDPRVRQAAALAMAFSRLGAFAAPIENAAKIEKNDDIVALLGRASEVLSGGNLRILAGDYERIGSDSVRRVRFFGDQ